MKIKRHLGLLPDLKKTGDQSSHSLAKCHINKLTKINEKNDFLKGLVCNFHATKHKILKFQPQSLYKN